MLSNEAKEGGLENEFEYFSNWEYEFFSNSYFKSFKSKHELKVRIQ